MERRLKKVRGTIFTKIVWCAGVIFTALLSIGSVVDLKNGINANGVCECIKMVLYLVSFVIGLVYLFEPEENKFALASACIYALAAVLGFCSNIFCGSRYAVLDMIHMVVNVIAFIAFAFTVATFLNGKGSRTFYSCAKLWWFPYAVSLIMAFVVSINTEINDNHGFDVSLVVIDVMFALILLMPAFFMTLTVKNRAELL